MAQLVAVALLFGCFYGSQGFHEGSVLAGAKRIIVKGKEVSLDRQSVLRIPGDFVWSVPYIKRRDRNTA